MYITYYVHWAMGSQWCSVGKRHLGSHGRQTLTPVWSSGPKNYSQSSSLSQLRFKHTEVAVGAIATEPKHTMGSSRTLHSFWKQTVARFVNESPLPPQYLGNPSFSASSPPPTRPIGESVIGDGDAQPLADICRTAASHLGYQGCRLRAVRPGKMASGYFRSNNGVQQYCRGINYSAGFYLLGTPLLGPYMWDVWNV